MADALEAVVGAVGSILAPPRCAACDEPVAQLAVFCRACAATAQGVDTPSHDFAAFGYGGAIAQAIARFKYGQRPDLARPLGDLLWAAMAARCPDLVGLTGAVVVPVPMHPARLIERGYNQAALLAGRLAKRLAGQMRATALARVRDTARQASLDRQARSSNLQGAFRVRHAHMVAGRRVLLVDDVRTTGATLSACSAPLLHAGAASVRTVVLARAE